jgi:hypothetical protein
MAAAPGCPLTPLIDFGWQIMANATEKIMHNNISYNNIQPAVKLSLHVTLPASRITFGYNYTRNLLQKSVIVTLFVT